MDCRVEVIESLGEPEAGRSTCCGEESCYGGGGVNTCRVLNTKPAVADRKRCGGPLDLAERNAEDSPPGRAQKSAAVRGQVRALEKGEGPEEVSNLRGTKTAAQN